MADSIFKRGDIITVCLNPVVGNELQGERRPALVLSSSEFHKLGLHKAMRRLPEIMALP